jgi:hypothetical protein
LGNDARTPGKPAQAANVSTTFEMERFIQKTWFGRMNARWPTPCVDEQAAQDSNHCIAAIQGSCLDDS